MQFKEALKSAGLSRPGRTTWCGTAVDGTAVFTIWLHDVHDVDGRLFAWWDHNRLRITRPAWPAERLKLTPSQRSRATTFIKLAAANIGKASRAVIIRRNE